MREEIIHFIKENNLSVFGKNNVRAANDSIFKTKDAKETHQKTISLISKKFKIEDTKQILKLFERVNSESEVQKRQEFFKGLRESSNNHFFKLKKKFPFWRAPYDSVVITEDEGDLIRLRNAGCQVIFVNQQSDLVDLDKYDLVQYINCENFGGILERIPQSIEIHNLEDARLEKNLEELSAWKDNIEIIGSSNNTEEVRTILEKLSSLIEIIEIKPEKSMTIDDIEFKVGEINEKVLAKIKEMTLSGDSVVSLLVKGIPKEIKEIVEKEITESRLPRELFLDGVPIGLDDREVESFLKKQNTKGFLDIFGQIKKKAEIIKQTPKLIFELEHELVYQDFISGIYDFKRDLNFFPTVSEDFRLVNSKNLFLENPQPISFYLNLNERCSILTGANSGGKTTLLEHLIQLITLSRIGLSTSGELSIPLFEEVYYFAKNKGSMSKGAFETLLTQMSEIKFGNSTLILADEIEAVTEPGVAGEIIISTAEYFIQSNCYLVIATHLGQEVKNSLPAKCRIDGIEATGLTENYELIVNHNPVLGKIANSTPELIIERMAKTKQNKYLSWLFENLERKRN